MVPTAKKEIHLLSSSEWFHIEAASSFKGSKRCLDVLKRAKNNEEFHPLDGRGGSN